MNLISVKTIWIKAKKTTEISIQFLQVPEATLNQWLQEEVLTRVETSDNLLMGYILDLNKIMTTAQYQVKVLKSENFALATEQIYTTKLTFPKSADDSQIRNLASQLGVSAFATLDSMTDESVAGQLESQLARCAAAVVGCADPRSRAH